MGTLFRNYFFIGCLAFSGFGIFLSPSAELRAERSIPPLTGPVIDEAGRLEAGQREALSNLIRSFVPLVQMQVWIVKSLEGDSIESLSIRATDKWKLGTQKEDKGLLILVAVEDRQMRIEVGQGLEGSIPDALAGRIIEAIMKPAFRGNDFYGGIRAASIELYRAAGGEAEIEPAPDAKRKKRLGGLPLDLWIILIFFGFFGLISPFLPRSRGRGGSGTYWGGGGSSWGGGGGGWSGGGGGFSGGGSSGSW